MKNQIELTQQPIIKHDLVAVGANVTKRIEELNIENLVVTNETIKSMKSLRAELNNEFAEYEEQRKAVKTKVSDPYVEFNKIYKTEIEGKYTKAVSTLKTKIGVHETKIKEEKEAKIKAYFAELCQVEKIDFVKFEQLNIKIDLSTSAKKYKEFCNTYILKVQEDIKLIESEEFQAEIMAEYKTTLNASKAITDLRARKEAEKAEREKILIKRTQEREGMLRKWGMSYFDIAKAFTLAIDETISVKQSDIETFSNEDWQNKVIVLDLRIKEAQAKALSTVSGPVPESKPVAEVKKPLESPKEVVPEETFKAKFEVEASMSALKALGEYMKAQGIEYKNID